MKCLMVSSNLNKTLMQVFLHRLLRFVRNVHVLYLIAITLVANGTTSCTLPFNFTLLTVFGEAQGWRSGESTRLPPMWPGFDSRS